MSRPPWERMLRLHRLIQGKKFPNCRSLSEDLEVSGKTIQRDIDFMRCRLNLPIEYDQLKFGFYYTEPVTDFPGIEMTEGELVALFIAQKALAEQGGTPFEQPLRTACRKLAEGLRERVTVNWADLDAAVSFRSTGVTREDLAVVEEVSRAVIDAVEVQFSYLKLGSNQSEMRRVRPYHLGCVNNQWYLFGHDLDREQMRTFALVRIRDIKLTGVKFQRPPAFSIARHLAQSFGVFNAGDDGRTNRIRIRFDDWAARMVGERTWHASQKIRKRPGGIIELTMKLGSLEEVERWVLSWGDHAQVLAPKALQERIRKVASGILRNCGK